jgi:exonuclease VII small subunit
MPLSAEDLILIDGRIEARFADLRIHREAFDRLEASSTRLDAAVARLAEGQSKLEAAVTRLTEGQSKLEAAVARLTEGQAKLFEGQAKLFEGQAKLFEGQARLEAAVARLTEGQAKLFEGQDALRREVGALSENVGFGLEELAATFLPAFLEKHEGLRISALARAFVPEDSPQAEEVDLAGTARRNGDVLTVVVECKGRIYGREVREFEERLARIEPSLPHPVFPVMVAYVVHPSAKRESGRIRFVSSHQL